MALRGFGVLLATPSGIAASLAGELHQLSPNVEGHGININVRKARDLDRVPFVTAACAFEIVAEHVR
jgi:hypothetical protein